jgi:DNA-binding transcriptional LysR family regulator
MELRHLRYFVALAEELHFGRAARRLNIVQPALSQQLRQLESELGVMLLARTKRRVMLTEAGRAFHREAQRTLLNAEQSVLAARSAAAGEVGRLRIGYVDLATWSVLPEVLRTYRRQFPQVELMLTELHRVPQREALLRGDLDVGFFSLTSPRDGLNGARITEDELVVAMPRNHVLARHKRIRIEQLRDEAWVLYPRHMKTLYVELVLSACAAANFVPRVVQEAEQLYTLRALVGAGFGVTLLPAAVAAGVSSDIATRPLTGQAPRLPLDVIWREGDLSAAGAQFVAVAQAVSNPLQRRSERRSE